MRLRMWTYDLAREQSANLDVLRDLLRLTEEAGYDALGLYLEHRFAYESAPWATGREVLTKEMVRVLRREFPRVRLIPFVNLLGHMEGFLYTERGKAFREEPMKGLQACPLAPGFTEFCEGLLDDVLSAFDDELIHLGGDETAQLGACPRCADFVRRAEPADGKAALYAQHFAPLIRKVEQAGRTPALWADMIQAHPEALSAIPPATVLFDWQYFGGCAETMQPLRDAGFRVVGCPALQTYNSLWMNLLASESNVRTIADDIRQAGEYGVCVTTWENGLFGAYDTLYPAISACGEALNGGEGDFLTHYLRAEERYEDWARLMGVDLPKCGGTLTPGKIRSSLKVRLLLMGNPFLAWQHHAEEMCGEVGEQALKVIEHALHVAPDNATRGVSIFARNAIDFVRLVEAARVAYAEGRPGEAIGKLSNTRQIFEDLERIARRSRIRTGASIADEHRCRAARRWVEVVIQRVREFGDGALGYLPAFEVITHPSFTPHDQGCWWIVNRWAQG